MYVYIGGFTLLPLMASLSRLSVALRQKASEVVLWDFIVESREQAEFHFEGLTSKYPLVDKGKGLKYASGERR